MSKELQKNLDFCNRALELKTALESNFLVLGEYLYQIKEGCLYEPNWQSWQEFSWELKMSENSINKLMQIYKTLILGYGFTHQQILTAGGWSMVAEVLPMITSKKDALKWLTAASNLTRGDLRKEIKEAKTGLPMAACSHKNTFTMRVCRDCGEKHEVFDAAYQNTAQNIPNANTVKPGGMVVGGQRTIIKKNKNP